MKGSGDMAELYSFFDPKLLPSGLPDIDYNAQEFTDYFGDLVTTGVMKGKAAELKVTANGSNMISEIDTGVAFVEGKRYANTAKLAHTHDTETLGKSRIDRIVVRMDLNPEARHVKSFIKKGVGSASPVPPVLTQTANVYEISLAQVRVIGGQTYINVADVVDERGKDVICPWAGSNILPNFNAAGLQEVLDLVSGHISNKSNPHNVTTDQVTHLGTFKFSMGDSPYHYPYGVSSFFVGGQPDEGSWPGYGTILTVKSFDNGGGTLQIFTPYGTGFGGGGIQMRFGNYPDGAWGPWITVANGKLPNYIPVVYNVNYQDVAPNYHGLQFYKDGFGIVRLGGAVLKKEGAPATICTLPVGYRPSKVVSGIAFKTASNTPQVTVTTDGNVNMPTAETGIVFIDMTFRTD